MISSRSQAFLRCLVTRCQLGGLMALLLVLVMQVVFPVWAATSQDTSSSAVTVGEARQHRRNALVEELVATTRQVAGLVATSTQKAVSPNDLQPLAARLAWLVDQHVRLTGAYPAQASLLLGNLHAKGLLGQPDWQKAETYWSQAAYEGLPQAHYELGRLQARRGCLADAYAYYIKAARHGHQAAQLAADQLRPQLTQDAVKQAVTDLAQADAINDKLHEATAELQKLTQELDALQDAVDKLKRLEDELNALPHQSFATTSTRAASTLSNDVLGDALTQTRERALAGDPRAQYDLAIRYRHGVGLAKNPKEALLWAQRAAHSGYPMAMALMSALYSRGEGVPRDPVQAAAWLKLASLRGETTAAATVPTFYEAVLSQDERLEADQRVVELGSQIPLWRGPTR
jgi:TPR repeat protein